MDILKQVGVAVTELPPSFTPHKQIRKVYDLRRAMIESGGCCHDRARWGGGGQDRGRWVARGEEGYMIDTGRVCLTGEVLSGV